MAPLEPAGPATLTAIRDFFQEHGLVSLPEDDVWARLAESIGSASAKRLRRKWRDALSGRGKMASVYRHFESVADAFTMMSLQADVVVASNAAVYEAVAPHVKPGMNILDLGCFAGGLAAKLAKDFAESNVVGADRATKLIDACGAHYGLKNLAFLPWEYEKKRAYPGPPADLLTCVLGTDDRAASLRVHKVISESPVYMDEWTVNSTWNPLEKTESAVYTETVANYRPILRAWRQAAREGARLYSTLRLSHAIHQLAFCNAARLEGWQENLSESGFFKVEDERFPLFVLEAESQAIEPMPFPEFTAWAASMEAKPGDQTATHRFLTMEEREPVRSQLFSSYDGSELQYEEVGSCREGWYFLVSNTHEYVSLETFRSQEDAEAGFSNGENGSVEAVQPI